MAKPADLPGTLALLDLRHQVQPAQQFGQGQAQGPKDAFAIEAADPRGGDLQHAGPGQSDQDNGAVSGPDAKARAASAAFASASYWAFAAAAIASRRAARQRSKGSGAGAPTNSSM